MGAKDNERLKKNLSIHLVIAIAPDIIIYIIVLKRLMKWLSRRLLRHASRWWGVFHMSGRQCLRIFLHFSRPTLLRFPGTRRQQQYPWVLAPHVGYRRKGVAADGHRAAAAAARLSSLFTIFDDSIISVVMPIDSLLIAVLIHPSSLYSFLSSFGCLAHERERKEKSTDKNRQSIYFPVFLFLFPEARHRWAGSRCR